MKLIAADLRSIADSLDKLENTEKISKEDNGQRKN